MQNKFLKNIINYTPAVEESVECKLYARNMGILPITAIVVIFISLYWSVMDRLLPSYNLVPVAKVAVYVQLIMAVYMLVLSYLRKKTCTAVIRISFLVYYAVIIAGVAILGITRNMKIIEDNAISDYVGVSVSAFYMFLIMFMPMPKIFDSVLVGIMMILGLLAPEIMYRTSSYSLMSHIILAIGFVTAFHFFRKIQLSSAKHEIELAKMSDELMTDSVVDSLTTVLNRRAMDLYVRHMGDNSKEGYLGVILFDLDYFREYNDYYGHVTGDVALKRAAVAAMNCLEEYEDMYLFRYSGDKFIVMVDSSDSKLIKEVMGKIRNAVYAAKIERTDITAFDRVTVTVGAAVERIPNVTGDYVISAANQLSLGKKTIKNSAYFDRKRIDIRGAVEDDVQIPTDVDVKDYVIEPKIDSDNGPLSMGALLEAVNGEIRSAFSINFARNVMTSYRIKENMMELKTREKTLDEFGEFTRAFINKFVHPNDRAQLIDLMDMNKLRDNLKKVKTVSRYYRIIQNGGIKNLQLRCMRIGPAADFDTILFLVIEESSAFSVLPNASRLENDELTGVYTRQAFLYHAREIIDANPGDEYSIVITDIDNFKLVNTVYGDHQGDQVLKHASNIFNNCDKGIITGRYGADQFVLLARTDISSCAEELEARRKNAAEKAPVPYLTFKMGVYAGVDHNESIANMCDKAILALKRVKHNYSNDIGFFDGKVLQQHYKAQLYEATFERAIAEKEFVIWCQAERQASTEKIMGAEALVRWITSDGTFIPPNEFIPVFEANGFIERLDTYVMRFVCEKQKQLMDSGKELLPISVNMSRSTLFHPDTVDTYAAIIEEYGIPKEMVPLEITESSEIDNEEMRTRMYKLKEKGFILYLDDFGSGYSSLSNLSVLPFDGIKLDKTLIDNINTSNGAEVLRHFTGLIHSLGMKVVAEGVETDSQFQFLKGLGCDLIQGYYFNKPVPYQEYENLITQ